MSRPAPVPDRVPIREQLESIRSRILTHKVARDAALAAWHDRPPGDEVADSEHWTAYLDARAAYERALEEWYGVSLGVIEALEVDRNRTLAEARPR